MTDLQEVKVEFPQSSSPIETRAACEKWGVTQCPLKLEYWETKLEQCGFRSDFIKWMLRTIAEGVDIGYKGEPRNHIPYDRVKTAEEVKLLTLQYEEESTQGRVVTEGEIPPLGKWFLRFFMSPAYTISKKRVIGQL